MAYTTKQAVDALDRYLHIDSASKLYIPGTKDRGFVMQPPEGEDDGIVIFIYPLVHKQDNTKNFFDTRDSGAYERGVAWKYAKQNHMKYFCFGVNDQVEKYRDYIFSLECNELKIELISGTKNGVRNGPGNQIIIPNDYVPKQRFERITNKLGIYISVIHKEALQDYIVKYDNRPYMEEEDRLREMLGRVLFEFGQNEQNQNIYSAYMQKSGAEAACSSENETRMLDNECSIKCEDQTADQVCKSDIQAVPDRDRERKTAEYVPPVYHTNLDSLLNTHGRRYERNRIVFGAPGTGKSQRLKKDSEHLLSQIKGIDTEDSLDGTFERVTFHPDYTYSQFVGTYKPVSAKGDIRYQFVPGPFMRVYVEALRSGRSGRPRPHLLLIEEINRAKVAAVFGDIFQLLDRDEDGVSEYEIHASEDLRAHLAEKLGGVPENYRKIQIPDNMYIWATMNSADQGVFPVDTAFKRRWSFEYIGIDENDKDVQCMVMLGEDNDAVLTDWNRLRKAINSKLALEYKVNEDKLMGPYFLSGNALKTRQQSMETADRDYFISVFKSKVLMYLYEDAAKQYKHKLFAGSGCDSSRYSAVCDAFEKMGMRIFGNDFKAKYYD